MSNINKSVAVDIDLFSLQKGKKMNIIRKILRRKKQTTT